MSTHAFICRLNAAPSLADGTNTLRRMKGGRPKLSAPPLPCLPPPGVRFGTCLSLILFVKGVPSGFSLYWEIRGRMLVIISIIIIIFLLLALLFVLQVSLCCGFIICVNLNLLHEQTVNSAVFSLRITKITRWIQRKWGKFSGNYKVGDYLMPPYESSFCLVTDLKYNCCYFEHFATVLYILSWYLCVVS